MYSGKMWSQKRGLLLAVMLALVFVFAGTACIVYAEEATTYTVTFQANGGTWDEYFDETEITCEANEECNLPKSYDIERAGYKFLGWTEVKDGTDVLTDYYTVTKNVTLYAKWEKIPVITLNLNGGSWKYDYATQYGSGIVADGDGNKYIPSDYCLGRDHYEFLGWSETQNGTVKVEADGGYYTAAADITLYALWKKLPTVTFDLTGGSWNDTTDAKEQYGSGLSPEPGYETVSLPGSYYITRDSYAFTGWAATKDGTPVKDQYGGYYKLTGDITLYAKWKKLYTVKFDLTGGSWKDADAKGQYEKGVTTSDYSDTVYLPSEYYLTRKSYGFVGWAATKNGSTLDNNFTPKADTTLYAKWKRLYTVKLDLNGGSWKDSDTKERYSKGVATTTYSDEVYLPSSYNVKKDSYRLVGWSKTKNGASVTSENNYDYKPEADTTLYAIWEREYTLKFNLNGGSWAKDYYDKNGKTGTKTESASLPDDYYVKRAGYVLLGWTTKKDSGTIIEEYQFTADATVYAKWEKGYTITYNINGGKWDSTQYKEGKTVRKNSEVDLPGEYYAKKKGYVLVGWSTKKNGSLVPSEYKATKNTTLYAKWAKAIPVTFDAGKGYFGSNKKTTKKTVNIGSGYSVGSIITDDEYIPQNGKKAFVGWYKDKKCKKPAKKSDIIKKKTTYYAKWVTNAYKITVTNLKGASYTNRATDEYISENESTASSYSFYIAKGESIGGIYVYKNGKSARLYYDKACKEKPHFSSYIPTGNTTVYAKFLDTVTVSWDADGGNNEGYNREGRKQGEVTSYKTLMCEDLPDVYRNGYYFVGWYDAAKPSKILPASHVFSKDTTVKAKWAKGIKITLKLNGGKYSDYYTERFLPSFYVKAKAPIRSSFNRVSTPSRTGYTFMGWKSSATKKVVRSLSGEIPSKATTYTAVWAKDTVKVTLMAEAGSLYDNNKRMYVAKAVVNVPKGKVLSEVSLKYNTHDEPSKHMDFIGWAKKKNGKVLSADYKFTKAVTLYPIWAKDTDIRVAMVTNGGALNNDATNNPVVRYVQKGGTTSLPDKSEIEREGYKLVGWYTDFKCTKKIGNPKKFKPKKNCYVYAKWAKK